jgi:rubrerythrin
VKKLAERKPEKLLDLLNERLTFERAGVRLYDAVVAKMQEMNLPDVPEGTSILAKLKMIRTQEKEHEEWLEEQIRALGGTAHEETDRSDLVQREARGIIDVIEQDSELPHLFHALLTAELVDESGWKLLLELADEAEDDEARAEIAKRTREEEDHLVFVRSLVASMARAEILGRTAQNPAASP